MSKWTRANPLAAVPGYNVPRGHFANGYTNGGDRVGFKRGGSVRDTTRNPHKDSPSTKPRRERPKASDLWRKTAKKGGWIQDATASIKKRGTKGKCTPITKKGCTGRAKALAMTFKKMGKARKGK
jgi:hypothetical protein